MCCSAADWKREIVPDHKWDYVDVHEFRKTDFMTRFKYVLVYVFIFKNLAVYGLDTFTCITMLATNHWSNAIYTKCGDDCAITINFNIAKWIFVGCLISAYLLLAYESYKARKVILSRDISYSFTNLMANDYYSIRNYDNFCLFCRINSSTKRTDDFAFWIFFTFKGWKRLILADGPRQSINALTLYSFAYAVNFEISTLKGLWSESPITVLLLWAMILTVLIFIGSLILLSAAGILYIPLLCYIQGNLKEYVCHKVDKRISELIKRMQKQRIARNAALEKKLARGGQITNGKGEAANLPQPTLPQIALEDDLDYKSHLGPGTDVRPAVLTPAPQSVVAADDGYFASLPPSVSDYEIYDSYASDAYPSYPPSLSYGDEYGSSTHLVDAAAPPGMAYPPAAQTTTYTPSSSRSNLYPPPTSRSQEFPPPFPTSRSQHDLQSPFQAMNNPLPTSRSQHELALAQPPFPTSRSMQDVKYDYVPAPQPSRSQQDLNYDYGRRQEYAPQTYTPQDYAPQYPQQDYPLQDYTQQDYVPQQQNQTRSRQQRDPRDYAQPLPQDRYQGAWRR